MFREYHKKTNITFSEDETLVNYFQMKYWTFDEARSSGSLSDEIYTLNMIAVQSAEATRWPGAWAEGDYPFMQVMLGTSIDMYGEELFLKALRNEPQIKLVLGGCAMEMVEAGILKVDV